MGGPASQVNSLRVIAVTPEKSYANPGETVPLRLTFEDALNDNEDNPRKTQIMWLGGCVNPIGGTYLGCFVQFAQLVPGILSGQIDGEGIVTLPADVSPEDSGVPDAQVFNAKVPETALMNAEPTDTDAVYSTMYVFFALCAGNIKPAAADSNASFPLQCFDDDGNELNPDSYVAGYTQLFIFSDKRTNPNPSVLSLQFDGKDVGADPESAPTVPQCAPAAQAQGCSAPATEDCDTFELNAVVDENVDKLAQVDPESTASAMTPTREAVWVDYFADGGSFSGAKKLIFDPALGYKPDHTTKWTPPGEAGLVTLWAVVHDARGGSSVTRRFVRVE